MYFCWVSLEYCVFLEATPPAATYLGVCTSTGAGPNLVRPRRAMCYPSILIKSFSSRLSYNTLRGAHCTAASAPPIYHLQRSFSPRPPNGPLFIIGHTPRTHTPLFGSLILVLVPLRFPSTISTSNTSVPRMQWNTFCLLLLSSYSFGSESGNASSLGVPTRLKDRICSYPAMLPEPPTRARSQDKLQLRRGSRTILVVSVRRNVRIYIPDPVKSTAI